MSMIRRIGLITVLVIGAFAGALLSSPAQQSWATLPIPINFMRNIAPGDNDPAHLDGAAVAVIYGLGAGLSGSPSCQANYPLNQIVDSTRASLDAGQRTITEISPQSICSPNVQDWENVLLQLVVNIESDPLSYNWGGIMLDEEDGFWDTSDSATAYETINNSLAVLMANVHPNGVSWYYTETFSSSGPGGITAWDLSAFNRITGYSQTAPQIANQPMANLVNQYQGATNSSTLVTWGFLDSYKFDGCPDPGGCTGFYQSEVRVAGAPYHNQQWNMDLSNCFSNTLHCDDWDADTVRNVTDNCPSVYNPDQRNTDGNNRALLEGGPDALGDACDDDADGDGYTNAREQQLGKDPLTYCRIMRADVNGDGATTAGDLAQISTFLGQRPGGRYDQDGNAVITAADLAIASRYVPQHAAACP